jgi:hydroxyacylglutathione hydrolase
MPLTFKVFPCLADNVGILLHNSQTRITVAIDAPDAFVLIRVLEEEQWNLTHILLTHKHADHIGGVSELKARFGAHVYGPKEIPGKLVDTYVSSDACVILENQDEDGEPTVFRVLSAPGHTLGHVIYWYEVQRWLFVGDVLFALGCGRLFEGTASQMWRTLETIQDFPEETLIFCGHEYTCRNADFVLSLEPNNEMVRKRAQRAAEEIQAGRVCVPFSLKIEKDINPFLRVHDTRLQRVLFSPLELKSVLSSEDVFSELRQRRDSF